MGGILGAVVFHAVIADTRRGPGYQLGQFLAGIGVGLAGGVVGVALLRTLRLGEVLGTTAQLASVVAVAAGCDILRDDAGRPPARRHQDHPDLSERVTWGRVIMRLSAEQAR